LFYLNLFLCFKKIYLEEKKKFYSKSSKDEKNQECIYKYKIKDVFLVNFKEIYHLFPYFLDFNNNMIAKKEYLKDYTSFVTLMNTYFAEEILSINSINQSDINSKIPIQIKLNSASIQIKTINFPNPNIKNITERVSEGYFRFLNMDLLPTFYFKYNFPNTFLNKNVIAKVSKKLFSMVFEIEKRIEKQKISSDLQIKKKNSSDL